MRQLSQSYLEKEFNGAWRLPSRSTVAARITTKSKQVNISASYAARRQSRTLLLSIRCRNILYSRIMF